MKIKPDKRLFWFLKEDVELDLSNEAHLDMYVQQTLSRGKTSDIQKLIRTIKPFDFVESFGRIKNFLPEEVRGFWEDWFGDTDRHPEKDTKDDSTAVHFGLDSPFRFEQPFEFEKIPGVKVDSLIDIATNKLLALFGRAELRDFIDVHFLVKEHYAREYLMEKSAQKDPGFDQYWLGVALERIDHFSSDWPDMLLLTRPCSINEIKDLFRLWRKDILKEITS